MSVKKLLVHGGGATILNELETNFDEIKRKRRLVDFCLCIHANLFDKQKNAIRHHLVVEC